MRWMLHIEYDSDDYPEYDELICKTMKYGKEYSSGCGLGIRDMNFYFRTPELAVNAVKSILKNKNIKIENMNIFPEFYK